MDWTKQIRMGMTCYTDWKFIRAANYDKAKGLLKYLTYREDRDNQVPRPGGPDRWVDCGLGRNWREIIDNVSELQSQKVLMRSLIIRPPQEQIAQLEQADPELWARRRELMAELVENVMAGEMERVGVEWPGGRQPLDLPYSYVIHAPPDSNGVESLHAHVITPAMDREREQAFNVYRKDTQHTREVAERETERIFELSRVRDREVGVALQPEIDPAFLIVRLSSRGGRLQDPRLCQRRGGALGNQRGAGFRPRCGPCYRSGFCPHEQTFSWNGGMCLRCHPQQIANRILRALSETRTHAM